jgi:uncharacterized protein
MLLQNHFDIDVPIAQAWEVLTDLEQVAPCMPGAVLESRDGDRYRGTVKIKVGPISAHFRGSAAFTELDEGTYRAAIEATGKDPRGGAAASARISAQLERLDPTRTRVALDTDLDISGRVAQFGRGALADVSHRLLGQFAANLNDRLRSDPRQQPSPRRVDTGGRDPIDSIDAAMLLGRVLRDRAGPPLAAALIGFLIGWLVFRARPRH